MDEPSHEPAEQRDEPKDERLNVTAQYGGGNDRDAAAPTGLRGLWKRLRGK